MRAASAGLLSLINSGNQEWVKADLFTWSKYDGSVLARYTDADIDLTLNGNTYLSSGPTIERDYVMTALGVQVAEMSVTVCADDTHLLGGVPWLRALCQGMLDGGRLLVERFMSDSWANTGVGTVTWFGGRVGPMTVGRSQATIKIRSDVSLLNVSMPRNPYQPECRHTLFDAGCTLLRSSFVVSSTAASGSTAQTINCGLAQAAGFFDLGTLQFTGGPNAGTWRAVRSYTPGVLVLSVPLPSVPGIGDAFNVSPGCDKLQATCSGKFANLPNFGGYPYIPIAESMA